MEQKEHVEGNRPTFSIIIPSYNYAHYLSEAIDSVLAQQRGDVEIIVVDDGSTDETQNVIAEYGNRIKAILLKSNRGAAGAWAAGLEVATGRYVCKLDADDRQLPGFLDAVEAAFSRAADVGFVATSVKLFRDNEPGVNEMLVQQDTYLSPQELRRRLLGSFFFRMPGTCLRRDLIDGQQPPVDALYQIHDWEFFTRVLKGYGAMLLARPLAEYRLHEASITATAHRAGILRHDLDRWLALTHEDPPFGLHDDERRRLIGSMAILASGGLPFPYTPRNALRFSRIYSGGLRIAARGGMRAVVRLHDYLVRGFFRSGGRFAGRLWRWAGNHWRRGYDLARAGGVVSGLRYLRYGVIRNTLLKISAQRSSADTDLRFRCNLCGRGSKGFLTQCGAGYIVHECICPTCGSFPRHRGLKYLLDHYLTNRLERASAIEGVALQFAPEPALHKIYEEIFPQLIGADISEINGYVDLRLDIQRLPFPDNSISFISSFHVIEHVPRDGEALREIARVLKPEGIALVCVPMNFNRYETIEFGRPNELLEWHYYDYGLEFLERVQRAGLVGEVFRLSEIIPESEYRTLSLQDEEIYCVGPGDGIQKNCLVRSMLNNK